MQNVLIIFQASTAATEGLALALGLGAVQRHANIRLRHLDPTGAQLEHQSYGTLQPADLLWAEGIAIVCESWKEAALADLRSCAETASQTADFANKWAFVYLRDAPRPEAEQQIRAMLPGTVRFLADTADRAPTLAYFAQVGQRLAELS